jgi:hypothetical protein
MMAHSAMTITVPTAAIYAHMIVSNRASNLPGTSDTSGDTTSAYHCRRDSVVNKHQPSMTAVQSADSPDRQSMHLLEASTQQPRGIRASDTHGAVLNQQAFVQQISAVTDTTKLLKKECT